MDHTAALAALPETTRARLTERSDAAGLRHLACHLGALLLTGSYITLHLPLWPLMMVPHGIGIVFLFTLEHECTHQTPFKTTRLNDAVGHGAGLLIGLPFTWFRYFHFAHHRFTNDPDRDPELADGGRPSNGRAWILYLGGWGYWTGVAQGLVRNARGQFDAPYLPPRRHAAMQREARILLAIYAAALASLVITPFLLWVWFLPLLLGQPFLRAYLLAEHGLCPPVANMLENSRTTFTNRAIRRLAWNMPYHAEHHSFPAVPFHHLPELHAELKPMLKSTSPGYVAFTKDYVQTLES